MILFNQIDGTNFLAQNRLKIVSYRYIFVSKGDLEDKFTMKKIQSDWST